MAATNVSASAIAIFFTGSTPIPVCSQYILKYDYPQLLMALHIASITAWILFIWGCITLLVTTLNWIVVTGLIGTPDTAMFMGWGVGSAELILSVCAMKIRQMLE